MNKSIYTIAEIGQAHDGSLGLAHSYINALAETGVNAVKFQVHIAEAESSPFEVFRVPFSYEDQTRYDYWKRMEFTINQWADLKQHCEDINLDFIASPFSNAAVDLMEQIGVKCYKIGSGEVNNFLMLEKIAETKKPIILSSGMSSFDEIDEAVAFLKPYHNPLTILQCTSAYPAKPEEWGLNVIAELKERHHSLPIGFSDHSGDIYACLAATALGAEVLEFHVAFDKRMFGPDSPASLSIDEVKKLVCGVRLICQSLHNKVDKTDISRYEGLRNIFGKSLSVNRDLKKGDVISKEMLEAKKPRNQGIDARDYKRVIGRKSMRDLQKWGFITEADIHE